MAQRPNFDDVRSAFERLDTPDKAAFVFEATFETIGQAIGETGRRVSEAVASIDFDALFRMDGTASTEAPPADTPPVAEPPVPTPQQTRASAAQEKAQPGCASRTDDAPPAS